MEGGHRGQLGQAGQALGHQRAQPGWCMPARPPRAGSRPGGCGRDRPPPTPWCRRPGWSGTASASTMTSGSTVAAGGGGGRRCRRRAGPPRPRPGGRRPQQARQRPGERGPEGQHAERDGGRPASRKVLSTGSARAPASTRPAAGTSAAPARVRPRPTRPAASTSPRRAGRRRHRPARRAGPQADTSAVPMPTTRATATVRGNRVARSRRRPPRRWTGAAPRTRPEPDPGHQPGQRGQRPHDRGLDQHRAAELGPARPGSGAGPAPGPGRPGRCRRCCGSGTCR